MSGTDWLIIAVLGGLVVLTICLDGIRRLDKRQADRLERARSERDYRRERDRLP